MLPVREFSSADDLLDHYRTVRKPVVANPGMRSVEVEVIRELSSQVAALRGLVHAMSEEMAGLRSEVATFKRDIVKSMVGVPDDASVSPVGTIAVFDIITAACRVFGCGYKDILSGRKGEHVTKARRAVYYLARELTKSSFPQIGRALRKDHTTVMSGIKRAEWEIGLDPLFADAVNKVRLLVIGGE